MAPVALVVLVVSVAAAAPSVEQRLANAQAELEELEYEQAAYELSVALSDPRMTDDQRFRANLMAGIANRIIGRDVDARLNFLYVLRRDPDVKLPASAPPKIRTFFDLVREEVRGGGGDGSSALALQEPAIKRDPLSANPQTGRAAISIATTPPGASVFLDSKKLGATPFTANDVNPGVGRVEVVRKDGGVVRFEVPLYDNEQTTVKLDYEEQPPPRGDLTLYMLGIGGKLAACTVMGLLGSSCMTIYASSFGNTLSQSSVAGGALSFTCMTLLCGLPGLALAGGGLTLGSWAIWDLFTPPKGAAEGRVAIQSPREEAPLRFTVPERSDESMPH